MAVFNEAIGLVLRNEGGYSNDSKDAGGETNFGISKKSFPNVNIRDLTIIEATKIYQRQFWDAHPQLAQLTSQAIATKTLDLMVNMGAARGVKILQSSINRVVTNGHPIPVDGKLGSMTVSRANEMDAQRLLHAMRESGADYYRAIVKRKPEQRKFLRGWLRRAYE